MRVYPKPVHQKLESSRVTYRFEEEVLDVIDAVDEVGRKEDGRDDGVRHEGPVPQVLHVQTVIALNAARLLSIGE